MAEQLLSLDDLAVHFRVGSVLAGLLWDAYGPPATFMAGGAFAVITLLGVLWVKPRQPEHEQR